MAAPTCSDMEFIQTFSELRSPTAMAKRLGINVRSVQSRRRAIEGRHGVTLKTHEDVGKLAVQNHQGRIDCQIENGTVIVFSDAHFWPGFQTTANRALVSMIRNMRPDAIIANGDVFDGATISRFPRPFFDEKKPTVVQELQICQERLAEIESVAKGAQLIWTLGNHDLRFEARLAAQAPEYEGIKGFHLKDNFPMWKPAWSYWINEEIEVRHRIRGGIHATWNNLHATHFSAVTGHLHALQVRPFTDGRGNVKYGVDTGTLADSDGPQFTDYLEGRQPNWRSGFVVLTFKNGQLLFPEVVMKHDEDHVQFRGHILHADTLEIM